MSLVTINGVAHSLILPFVDLSLLSVSAATAIIVNIILAVKVLKEKFIWQYDVSAMVLISSGSILIGYNAHTEQVNFTPEEIRALLKDPQAIIYIGLSISLFLFEGCMLKAFIAKLRMFEQDALAYEKLHGIRSTTR